MRGKIMSLWDDEIVETKSTQKPTQAKIHALYPTMVYENDLDDVEKINQEIDSIIDSVRFTSMDEWNNPHLLSEGLFVDDVITNYNLKVFSKVLSKNIKAYMLGLKSFNPNMSYTRQSWFTKCTKGHYAHVHNHGAADISGVYYYKTSGDDGSLFTQTPNPHLETSKLFFDFGNQTKFPPKVGRLYLFPAWLKHGVYKNLTDNTRISLSFNIILDNN